MEQTVPFPVRMLKCLLPAVLFASGGVALLMLLSAALLSLGLPDGWIPFLSHFTVLGASLGGGLFAGWKNRGRGLLVGGLTGLCVGILHTAVTLLWGAVSLSCLTYGLSEVLGGALGGIFGVNLRK